MRRISIPFFRIFYSSTYTVLLLILFFLLAATPGDHIYQTISNNKIGNVFVVAGVYIVTALIALFIYASRLYTNRVALAAIPRWYLPIEKGEVSNAVFKLITKNRHRSALVAWDTRPRDLTAEVQHGHTAPSTAPHPHSHAAEAALRPSTDTSGSSKQLQAPKYGKNSHHPDTIVPVNPTSPPWGHLSHPGWSSPSSPDLPNLHFTTVVTELPHLLEAKAVSLAPVTPSYASHVSSQGDDNLPPDPDIIAALQRPPRTGLRTYLSLLSELGVASNDDTTVRFLKLYEYARFSSNAISEAEFRDLMSVFSDLLLSFTPLDAEAIERIRSQAEDRRSLQDGSLDAPPDASTRKIGDAKSGASSRSSLVSTGSIAHYTLENW